MSLDNDEERGRLIVVGVSPATGSPLALQWAATEARYRTAPLHAVMAWRLPRTQAGPGGSPPAFLPAGPEQLQAEADARLTAAVRNALGTRQRVTCMAVRGSAVKVLLTATENAQLLVLDSPHSGNTATLRPGLIAPQVIYRAQCPVVMVPPSPTPRSLSALRQGHAIPNSGQRTR